MASLPPTALPNCSLSWTQNGRSEQRIQTLATLDLHGYTKERAMRALTDFLESSARNQKSRRTPFVCVLTGVGAHSGALGGPILKQAVHKLLMKRQMEFSYAKKKGSFLVNVHSGHVLKQNPTVEEMRAATYDGVAPEGGVIPDVLWQDTKVKVVPREYHPHNQTVTNNLAGTGVKKKKRPNYLNGASSSYAAASAIAPLNNPLVASTSGSSGSTAATTSTDHCPLPSEIAAEEKMLETAKSHSLQDTRKFISQRDKEQHTLEQVLQKTQQEASDAERLEQEELRKAMELSQRQQQEYAEYRKTKEEEELERILQLSLHDAQTTASVRDEDEDEEILQKFLSQSNLEHLHQQEEEEAELERILRMSVAEQQKATCSHNDSADEELERVLRLSFVEASQHNFVGEDSGNILGPSDLEVVESDEMESTHLYANQNERVADPEKSTVKTAEDLLTEELVMRNQPNLQSQPSTTVESGWSSISPPEKETPALHAANHPVQHASCAELTTGEALLDKILYNQPVLLGGNSRVPSVGTQNATMQTFASEQSSLLQKQQAPSPSPIIPQAVLERRMMEILQRPIIMPTTDAPQPRIAAVPLSTLNDSISMGSSWPLSSTASTPTMAVSVSTQLFSLSQPIVEEEKDRLRLEQLLQRPLTMADSSPPSAQSQHR